MSGVSPFQIEQLRMQNVVASLEAIGVFFLSLFVTAFGPSLLLRYLYADQQLMEQPKVLEILPVVCFVVGVGYFLFTIYGNITRELKARKLEKAMSAMCDSAGCADCCGGNCSCNESCDCDEESADTSFTQALKKSKKVSKKS